MNTDFAFIRNKIDILLTIRKFSSKIIVHGDDGPPNN